MMCVSYANSFLQFRIKKGLVKNTDKLIHVESFML